MATYKNVILRKDMPGKKPGTMWANLHVLIGYNQSTVQDGIDAIKHFKPFGGNRKNVHISHVTKSSYCDRFTAYTMNTEIDTRKIPKGWRIIEDWKHVDYWLSN